MRSKLMIALLAAPAVLGAQQLTDTTFKPISQQEAVRLAQQNNVSAVTSANAIRSANNAVRAARARYLPNLSLSLGQSKSAGERLGQSGTLVPYVSRWTYNSGVSGGVTLYDGGRTTADVRSAKATVTAQEANQITQQFSIALQVKQAYNAILAAKENEAVARAQLATAQLQLQTSIAKVNAGAANVSDSLRGVVQVGTAQLAILNAQNTFRAQSASLTHLVGTPYLVTADLSDTVDHPLAPIDSTTIAQLALNGPAIRQLEASVAAAQAAERAAHSGYLPTVSANFSYGGNGTGNAYGLGIGGDDQYAYSKTLGFRLSYPLFDNFTRQNQVASAQIAYENQQAQLRETKLVAQQNVITSIGTLRTAEATMRLAQISVRASEEDLRVVQQRYNLGASTLLEVLTSQQNLVTARNQLVQARFNYRNARAQIESVIGRDLP